jgi:hypothetical protein
LGDHNILSADEEGLSGTLHNEKKPTRHQKRPEARSGRALTSSGCTRFHKIGMAAIAHEAGTLQTAAQHWNPACASLMIAYKPIMNTAICDTMMIGNPVLD